MPNFKHHAQLGAYKTIVGWKLSLMPSFRIKNYFKGRFITSFGKLLSLILLQHAFSGCYNISPFFVVQI